MLTDEIVSILKKNGYKINDDLISKVQTMLSSIKEENQFYDLDYILDWFQKKRDEATMNVEEIGINELEEWNVSQGTGNISHQSGGFFEVIGVKVKKTVDREVGEQGWTQPMIAKNPGGILGILMKKFNGIPHFLLQAKAEPGNIDKLQLSPTLQATTSNLERQHGGKKPLFAEFFDGEHKGKVIYSRWQTEDGGRFYLKSNLNMIV